MIRKIYTTLILWFPVLPFMLYWPIAYLLFHLGKYITPDLYFETHLFVIAYYLIFALFYMLGLKYTKEPPGKLFRTAGIDEIKILKFSSMMSLIGTFLFVLDRISSGAGSFDMVQNEFSNIRNEHSDKTTYLTSLAVIPQSFKLIAIASYIYALYKDLKIQKYVHFAMLSVTFLELLNMILSANRGALFWILSYIFLYVIYIKRVNVFRELLSFRYFGIKIFLLLLTTVAYIYFLWVAENRVVVDTAEFDGRQAYANLKYSIDYVEVNYARLGAEYQLFYYITHGFTYTDAIYKHAPLINFDLLSPLGIRVEAQIQKFNNLYQHPANADLISWYSAEGLSLSGWASIFGASLAFFGVIGSLVFSAIIGYCSGFTSRRWFQTRSLGWFVMLIVVFSSLNMSFDWILRNFDQYVAILFGVVLIINQRPLAHVR